MPDDIWSSEPPTEPGFYWIRPAGATDPMKVVECRTRGGALLYLENVPRLEADFVPDITQLLPLSGCRSLEWYPVDPPGAIMAERERCLAIVRSCRPYANTAALVEIIENGVTL